MAHHAFFDSHDNAPNYISAFSANLNVMMQVAERAGRGLIHDFNEIEKLQISQKGAADFASTADFNSEKTIKEGLLKAKPKYGFLQEESGEIKGEDTSHRWIIDPLDGTMNFLHAVPHFAISIALQEDQEIIAGVIFNPITNEMFVAEKGKGAWIVTASGKTKLHVSNRSKLNETVVVTGIPHLGHSDKDEFIKQLTPMMEKTGGVRRMGSASLDMAYVAAGRFDCYWERDIKPWDIAAGALIVKEAGGVMTDLDSNTTYKEVLKSGSIIASNEVLAETFKDMLIVK
ncbi:MAG: inositol monophosphatase [Alphaproteobacteria bacterium]|nr:inositol monophosphatase [Alphaproteobacteria bacterium]